MMFGSIAGPLRALSSGSFMLVVSVEEKGTNKVGND